MRANTRGATELLNRVSLVSQRATGLHSVHSVKACSYFNTNTNYLENYLEKWCDTLYSFVFILLSMYSGMDCGTPSLGENQKIKAGSGSSSTRFPNNLTIVCSDGFQWSDAVAEKMLFCQVTGKWTSIDGTCACIHSLFICFYFRSNYSFML